MKEESLRKIEEAKKKKKKIADEKKIVILALDVATKCGWATEHVSGVWDLSMKKDESAGMRLLRLRSKLQEIHKMINFNLLTFERTSGQHKNALIVQSELHGVVKVWCEDNSVEYRAFSASEIKKHATGKGNAGKPAMIKAAQDKLGYKGKDDNEADALWIYNLTKESLYE